MALTKQQIQDFDQRVKSGGVNLDAAKMQQYDAIVNKATHSPYNQPTGIAKYLPDILGTIGSVGGEIIGTPADAVSGPAGTMVGGGIGGGVGEGLGQVIQNLMSGNPIQTGVGQEVASGGAMGAIPGAAEGKLAEKLGVHALENTGKSKAIQSGLRFGANALTGGISQEMQNLNPTATHGNIGLSTLLSGVLGAAGPEAAKALGKTAGFLSLGRGGRLLPELNQVIPGGVVGSANKVLGKVGLKTDPFVSSSHFTPKDPVEHELLSVLKNSPNGISRAEFSKALDEVIPQSTGPLGDEKAGMYKAAVQKALEDHVSMYEDHTGKSFSGKMDQNQTPPVAVATQTSEPSAGLNITPNKMVRTADITRDASGKPIQKAGTGKFVQTGHSGVAGNEPMTATNAVTPFDYTKVVKNNVAKNLEDIKLPLDFWHSFKQRLSKDAAWTGDATTNPQRNVAKNITGALASQIEDRSGKPKLVHTYNQLIGAQADIANRIKSTIAGSKGKEKVGTALGKFGALGTGILGSLLGPIIHHPVAAATTGLTTALLSRPGVGTRVARYSPSAIQQIVPRAVMGLSGQYGQAPSAMLNN